MIKLILELVWRRSSTVYECRRCGTTADAKTRCCRRCGHDEIVVCECG